MVGELLKLPHEIRIQKLISDLLYETGKVYGDEIEKNFKWLNLIINANMPNTIYV